MIDLLSTIGALHTIVALLMQEPTPFNPSSEDDISPMMLVILLATLAVCLVLLGIGIVLALVGIICTAILIALGLVSSSVVFALLRRRVSAGVRAFHYQICAVLATPAGVTLLCLASALFNLQMSLRSVLPLGALAGGVSGLLVAGVFDWSARLAYRHLVPTRESDAAPAISLTG